MMDRRLSPADFVDDMLNDKDFDAFKFLTRRIKWEPVTAVVDLDGEDFDDKSPYEPSAEEDADDRIELQVDRMREDA